MKTIISDAGHGTGSDNVVKGYSEASFALDVSNKFKKYIEETYKDVRVIETRTSDNNVSFDIRNSYAAYNNADMFISWHSNAAGNNDANGCQVYYHKSIERDKKLAELMLNKIYDKINKLGLQRTRWSRAISDSTIFRNGFSVLRNNNPTCPSVLIEALFHSNSGDRTFLKSDTFRHNLSIGVSDAVASYLDLKPLIITSGESWQKELFRDSLEKLTKKDLASNMWIKGLDNLEANSSPNVFNYLMMLTTVINRITGEEK